MGSSRWITAAMATAGTIGFLTITLILVMDIAISITTDLPQWGPLGVHNAALTLAGCVVTISTVWWVTPWLAERVGMRMYRAGARDLLNMMSGAEPNAVLIPHRAPYGHVHPHGHARQSGQQTS